MGCAYCTGCEVDKVTETDRGLSNPRCRLLSRFIEWANRTYACLSEVASRSSASGLVRRSSEQPDDGEDGNMTSRRVLMEPDEIEY